MIGVYVDIFPLDEFPYSNIEITNIQNRATKLFNSYMFTLSHYNLNHVKTHNGLDYLVYQN